MAALSALTKIPTGVVIRAAPTDATLPLAQLSKSDLEGKGKMVKMPEEPKKRKWIDKMTPTERAKIYDAEKRLLSREEGQYLKKNLEAEARAQQRVVETVGESSAAGITRFLFSFLSSFFFSFFFFCCNFQ